MSFQFKKQGGKVVWRHLGLCLSRSHRSVEYPLSLGLTQFHAAAAAFAVYDLMALYSQNLPAKLYLKQNTLLDSNAIGSV